MDCLINYIGVEDCQFAPSPTGLYLQQLPGMEFEQIEKISSPEQGGWAGVWADIQGRAARTFRRDVIAEFNRRTQETYKLKQITQSLDMGKWVSLSKNLTPNSGGWYGHTIELNNPEDVCVCSNMQVIYIQTVKVYCTGSILKVVVVDADYGNVYFTTTVSAPTNGWNIVTVEQEFWDARRLYVLAQTNEADKVSQNISQFNLMGFADDVSCSNCTANVGAFGFYRGWAGGCDCVSQVQGVSMAETINQANCEEAVLGTNIYGVSAVFTIRCGYGGLVCNNRDTFADAWRLRLAIEVLTQRIYSNRLNNWTTIDKDKAKKLRKEFDAMFYGGRYKESAEDTGIMYEGALELAVRGIYLNKADCCLQLDAPWVQREVIL